MTLRTAVVCAFFTFTGGLRKSDRKKSKDVKSHDLGGQFTPHEMSILKIIKLLLREYGRLMWCEEYLLKISSGMIKYHVWHAQHVAQTNISY